MIKGVKIKTLNKHKDSRGYLMEIIRADDDFFTKFGQFYVAKNKAGTARDEDWHYHKQQDDYFCCISGKVKVALYDRRPNSSTNGNLEFYILDAKEPRVIRIPRGVLHIYKTEDSEDSLLINMTTKPYDRTKPDELRSKITELVPDFEW